MSPTKLFLALLALFTAYAAFSLRSGFATPLYPVLIAALALALLIGALEWIRTRPPESRWLKAFPFLRKLDKSNDVPFWHRQVIALGVFCLAAVGFWFLK